MPTNLMLQDAWRDKANRSYATYRLSITAPGLFKPEFHKELTDEVIRAETNHNFWQSQE